MMFPLVLDLAADPIHKIPVAVTCRVLGFSKQALIRCASSQSRSVTGLARHL